jgi:hypothetical protein
MELADCWKALEAKMGEAFEKHPDLFQPALEAKNVDPQYAHELAHMKRFMEWWVADDLSLLCC